MTFNISEFVNRCSCSPGSCVWHLNITLSRSLPLCATAKRLMSIQLMSTGNIGQVCWARPPANHSTCLLAVICGQEMPEVPVWLFLFYHYEVVVLVCVFVHAHTQVWMWDSPAVQQQWYNPVLVRSFCVKVRYPGQMSLKWNEMTLNHVLLETHTVHYQFSLLIWELLLFFLLLN